MKKKNYSDLVFLRKNQNLSWQRKLFVSFKALGKYRYVMTARQIRSKKENKLALIFLFLVQTAFRK